MKTVIIYYSYSGKTRAFATKKAVEIDADIYEVTEKNPRSKFKAYLFGSFDAMKQKASEISPLTIDLESYEHIILAAPIWAGFPAPAMNSVIALLPSGKDVELYLTSGSGKSSGEEKVKALIVERACTVTGYHDIKESEIQA